MWLKDLLKYLRPITPIKIQMGEQQLYYDNADGLPAITIDRLVDQIYLYGGALVISVK